MTVGDGNQKQVMRKHIKDMASIPNKKARYRNIRLTKTILLMRKRY